VAAIGRGLAAWGPLRRNRPAWLGAAATVAFCSGLALLFARPLRVYYTENRTVDRLGETVVVVERNARRRCRDRLARFFIRPLAVKGADVLYLTQHLSLAELDDLAARYDRIWLLYTSNLPASCRSRWTSVTWPIRGNSPRYRSRHHGLAYRNLALTDPEASLKPRSRCWKELAQVTQGGGLAAPRHPWPMPTRR